MRKDNVKQAVELLMETQAELAEEGGRSATLRGDVVRLAQELESLAAEPPSRKATDFENKGAEVPLDEGDGGFEGMLERIIDESDLLPVSFLEQGVVSQRSVGRVVLTQATSGLPAGSGWGTGFLVSPDLFLTNWHVVEDAEFLSRVRFQFNFQLNSEGFDRESESYRATDLLRSSPFQALDYSLIRLQPKTVVDDPVVGSGTILPGERWGTIPLNPDPLFRAGQSFNIIQHPGGRRKEIALQNNTIDKLFTNVVLYTTDTEPGSSGSPVFDNLWQLVALHHAGGERVDGKWVNNEGIRIDKIVDDLRDHLAAEVLTELGI